ncbi:MAG: hypothetical protein DRH49_03055 [Candidatus Coatesbacteria bacterium]|nr:MAG: hypothetical protein DRH49_03055 [Candidatus Coatesbacteria bacterium]
MVIKPTIIVHGGASNLPDELVTPYYDGVLSAVKMGADALKSGGSALDAVETAVRYMEDNATFNAGRGGLILLSHNGDYAWAFNTTRMARAVIIDDKKPTVMVD